MARVPQVVTEDRASGAPIINNSLKFWNGNYLKRSQGSPTSDKKWTFSAWVKRTVISGNYMSIFSAGNQSYNDGLFFDGSDYLSCSWDYDNSGVEIKSRHTLRDTFGWYHVMLSVDSTQASADNRVKMFINGMHVNTHNGSATQNDNSAINQNGIDCWIGRWGGSSLPLEGSMSQVHFIDGQQLGPNNFGFRDPLTGIWRPRAKVRGGWPNDGTTWSDHVTFKRYAGKYDPDNTDFHSAQSGNPATEAFNGTFSNGDWANIFATGGNQTVEVIFTPPKPIPRPKSLRIWGHTGTDAWEVKVYVNGIEVQDMLEKSGSAGADTWVDCSERLDQLIKEDITEIKTVRYCDASGWGAPIGGIEMDGIVMVDGQTTSAAYGNNGFYLPFDGVNSAWKDQSGNNNHFTIHGIGLDTIENATGAFPIYETNSAGNVALGRIREDPLKAHIRMACPFISDSWEDLSFEFGSSTKKTLTNVGSIGFAYPATESSGNFYGNVRALHLSDSSSQRVEISDAAEFRCPGDFCIETWIYPTNSSAADGSLFVQESGGNYAAFNFDPSNQFNIYFNSGSASWTPGITRVNNGAWNHVALTRSGSTVRLFVNGQLESSTSYSGDFGYNSPSLNRIGGGASSSVNSLIQDYRFYNGAAKYTEEFIPASTKPDLIKDSPSGAPYKALLRDINKDVLGYGSLSIPDLDSYVSFPTNNFGANNLTIECWLYPHSASNTRNTISGNHWALYYGQSVGCQLYWRGPATGYVTAFFSTNDSSYDILNNFNTPAGTVPMGQWSHVALCRTGNTWTWYVNGVQEAQTSASGTVNAGTTAQHIAEYSPSKSNYGYGGSISNLRVVNGTCVYSGAFKPPDGPLTTTGGQYPSTSNVNVSIPSGHTKLLAAQSSTDPQWDSAATKSVSGPTITNNNDVEASTDNPYGNATTGSCYFDAVTTSLTFNFAAGSPTPNLGLRDYTVEFWMKGATNATSCWAAMLTIGGGHSTAGSLIIYGPKTTHGGGMVGVIVNQVNPSLQSETQIVNNGWHHIALCRSGHSTRLYVDGVMESNRNEVSGSVVDISQSSLTLGTESNCNTYFQGWISDVRIVNGHAVYLDDFTPPTEPLPVIGGQVVQCCTSRTDPTASGNLYPLSESWMRSSASHLHPFIKSDQQFRQAPGNYALLDHKGSDVLGTSPGTYTMTNAGRSWLGTGNNDDTAMNWSAGRTGKWYFEVRLDNDALNFTAGWTTRKEIEKGGDYGALAYYRCIGVRETGSEAVVHDFSDSSNANNILAGFPIGQGDVLGFGLVLGKWDGREEGNTSANDAQHRVNIYVNGMYQATAKCGDTEGEHWCPIIGDSSAGDAKMTKNTGQQPWAFPPPEGYSGLIYDGNAMAGGKFNSRDYVGAVMYTGSGSLVRNVNVGFRPDLIWTKSTTSAVHHAIYNSVSGPLMSLSTSRIDVAERIENDGIEYFKKYGWSTNGAGWFHTNDDGNDFVAWCWRAGGRACPVSGGVCDFTDGGTLRMTSTGLPLGSSTRTVEFWAMIQSGNNAWQNIFSYGNGVSGQCFGLNVSRTDNGGGGTFAFTGYSSGDWAIGHSVDPYLNEWHHYCLTYDGTQLEFYIDGTSIGTQTKSLNTTGSTFPIGGSEHSGFGENFKGYISNFRISDNERYTSNFTPSITPLTTDGNTKLLCCQSDTDVTDAATKPGTITKYSNVYPSDYNGPFSKFCIDDTPYASMSAAGLTDGTIPLTQLTVSQKAGFSIIEYKGDGSNANKTVAHGLGKKPEFIMVKAKTETSRHWLIWSHNIGDDEALIFDASLQAGSRFGPSAPDENHFGVYGGQGNRATQTFTAWCWTSIEGFSKFGQYKSAFTGTSHRDGVMVETGFKPAIVMIKCIANSNQEWVIFDNVRGGDGEPNANDSYRNSIDGCLYMEGSSDQIGPGSTREIDFYSNGFRARNSGGPLNGTIDRTYMYMAWGSEAAAAMFGVQATAR